MNRDPRPLDVPSLVWGLLFLLVALLGGWVAISGYLNWTALKIGAPLVLIALGILGLQLSRPRR